MAETTAIYLFLVLLTTLDLSIIRSTASLLDHRYNVGDPVPLFVNKVGPLNNPRYKLKEQEMYSAPMPWVGLYIAMASLVCTLAMAADTFQGFRHRKLLFPCKFFTLNAASLTVIAVAMKLPVDLNNSMPGQVDQITKLGSMIFMSTMMANFMPSLGSMGNKELLMNMTALAILVITMAVNIFIEITTDVIKSSIAGLICVAFMLFFLIISSSLALTVPTFKEILELKYRKMHKIASDDQEAEHTGESNVEKLVRDVSRYWVMAETGSPQFVLACSPICFASGVICLFAATGQLFTVASLFFNGEYILYKSDYKWSIVLIFASQSIGIVVATIAPVFRCFAALSFKFSVKWSVKHLKVYETENYWTQRLVDWKHSRIALLPLHIRDRKCKKFVHDVKNLILNFCIGFQIVIVVACKTVLLIPILFVILFLYCCYCFKSLQRKFMGKPSASHNHKGSECEQNVTKSDLSRFILQLQDMEELSERTLRSVSNSVNRLMQKAEKHQFGNLLKLLEKSTGFNGVKEFDKDQVPSMHSEEHSNCWSLPLVSLASMAISLPNITDDVVDSLLRSVCEGLYHVVLVEENLNSKVELVNLRKAAKHVWLEVELYHKWLDNNLQSKACKGKTQTETLQCLSDKAKDIVLEFKSGTHISLKENSLNEFIAANSMYRISQAILVDYQDQNDKTDEQLFEKISTMMADIFIACFANLPRLITMKCYDDAIEKREQSVKAAARVLGHTKDILEIVQKRELPILDPDQMAYIDEWRALLKHQNPHETTSSGSTQFLVIALE